MHPLAPTLICASFLLFIVPAGLPRQDARQAEKTLTFEAGEYDLADLVDKAAGFLGQNHLVDSSAGSLDQMRGNPMFIVRLQRKLELDRSSCLTVMSQILHSKGWVLTTIDAGGGLYEWVNMNGRRQNDIRMRAVHVDRDEVFAHATWPVYVVTTYMLKHVDANNAVNGLRAFVAHRQQWNLVATVGRSNAVVIAGFGPAVASTVRILGVADRPDPKLDETLQQRFKNIEKRLQSSESRLKRLEKK